MKRRAKKKCTSDKSSATCSGFELGALGAYETILIAIPRMGTRQVIWAADLR
jgi:hypothetical protein